jgi:hypothetical protein
VVVVVVGQEVRLFASALWMRKTVESGDRSKNVSLFGESNGAPQTQRGLPHQDTLYGEGKGVGNGKRDKKSKKKKLFVLTVE